VAVLEGAAAEEFTDKASGMRDYANSLKDGSDAVIDDTSGSTIADTNTISGTSSDTTPNTDTAVVSREGYTPGDTPITGTTLVSRADYLPTAGGTSMVSEGVTYVTNSSIFSNMLTNADNIATNAESISINAGRIFVNSERIASNVALINANSGLISSNTDMILQNTGELRRVTRGIAGVAALPDMFLASDETMAISGGVGFFGDQIGLGVTAAQRLNNSWSFGASIAVADDIATGKLQARWSK